MASFAVLVKGNDANDSSRREKKPSRRDWKQQVSSEHQMVIEKAFHNVAELQEAETIHSSECVAVYVVQNSFPKEQVRIQMSLPAVEHIHIVIAADGTLTMAQT